MISNDVNDSARLPPSSLRRAKSSVPSLDGAVQTHVEAGNGLSRMEMDGVNIFESDWITWTQNGEDAENNLQDRLRSDLMAQMAYDFKHHWTQHQASTGFHQVSGLLSSPFCFFGAGSSFQGEKSRNSLVIPGQSSQVKWRAWDSSRSFQHQGLRISVDS